MKYIIKISCFITALCTAGCNIDNQFQEEMYQKVFCLLSDNDQVFPVVHSFNEEESTGYLSVYCGGTNPPVEDITIEIERDNEMLSAYNKRYFDIDLSKYAKELDSSKYEILSWTTTMKAEQTDPYATIPIKVRPAGLSPDSIYMVPLKIKSISGDYTINQEKVSVMYRPLVENDYAQQKASTTYLGRGKRYELKSNGVDTLSSGNIVVTKTMFPLSNNQSRVTVGLETSDNAGTPDLGKINKFSIILTVNNENLVTISSYASIEVVQMGTPTENKYIVEDGFQCFYLHYKYRALNTPGTDNTPPKYSPWYIIQERLRREN